MYETRNDNGFTSEELKGTKPEPTFAGALSFLRRRYTRDLAGVPGASAMLRTSSSHSR
jgi:agmatinase